MTPPITVRPASSADVDAVTVIHAVAREAYYAAGGMPAPIGYGSLEATWARAQAKDELVCADVADQVVAFAAMGQSLVAPAPDAELFKLHALYVDPAHWGRGVGDRLHAEFRDQLQRGGFAVGLLEVWDGNSRALGFYQRRGWTLDGRARPGPQQSQYLGMTLRA